MALKTNLQNYYKLDEASGNALDSHGTNDLTETSGTIDAATGIIVGARDFEAADTEYFDFDNAGNQFETGDIDFTFQVWIKAETLASNPVVFRCGSATPANDYALFYNTGVGINLLEWQCVNPAGTQFFVRFAITTATWYHVIVWHDSVNNQIGMKVNNGAAQLNSAITTGVRTTQSDRFQLGASADQALYWDGLIDELAFWKGRVVTSAEITQLYNGGNGFPYPMWDLPSPFQYPGRIRTPPRPGTPWFNLSEAKLPPRSQLPPPPPAITSANASPGPGFNFGPPIPGSPWFFRSMATLRHALPTPPPVIPEVPEGLGRGRTRPFVPRVPNRMKPADEREGWERAKTAGEDSDDRHRRGAAQTEKLHYIINALISQGILVQTSPTNWVLRPGGFTVDRDPGANDDRNSGVVPGVVWVNTDTGDIFINKTNTVGAATWRGPI